MSNSTESPSMKVKCLAQQCLNAKLYTKLADKDSNTEEEFVQIKKGAVLFVCFMKEAQESDVEKLAKTVLNAKLSEPDSDATKHVSILELPGDLLIIPQATLGGRIKGKMFQYHYNISKDQGAEFYRKFIEFCKKFANEHQAWRDSGSKIEHGTYGIRQVYSTETNGPYSHIIEF